MESEEWKSEEWKNEEQQTKKKKKNYSSARPARRRSAPSFTVRASSQIGAPVMACAVGFAEFFCVSGWRWVRKKDPGGEKNAEWR
jgi:DNA replication protein DnaC